MSFYRASSQKKLRKFFKSHNFTLSEGGEHCKAVHNPTGVRFDFPRHNTISNGVTKAICDKLVELGYDKDEIERKILK
jgi:hypothetical protein